MHPKTRADQLAFDRGLAESREQAKSLIMAGRIVLPDTGKTLKPGQLLSFDADLRILPGARYVSRGAYKLLTILDAFFLDVTGKICLDAGASTGGFTDCLLKHGAAKVYAVDVGSNQLHEKLRSDERVISMEGINLRYAPPELIPEKVDFLTGDLSFISLTLVLPSFVPWLKPRAFLALLIKPQFELSPKEVPKGVVASEEARQKAVNKIVDFCENQMGFETKGVLPARIRGPKGNQEYMALFQAR